MFLRSRFAFCLAFRREDLCFACWLREFEDLMLWWADDGGWGDLL